MRRRALESLRTTPLTSRNHEGKQNRFLLLACCWKFFLIYLTHNCVNSEKGHFGAGFRGTRSDRSSRRRRRRGLQLEPPARLAPELTHCRFA